MFLQRNTAGQVFTLPGTLRLVADGSAVTSGASLTWIKDGTGSASAGTLTHVSDGCYTYAPSQGETDAKICGWVLSKTGAAGLAGSIRTTNADPNDGVRLALTALPNANANANGGLPILSVSGTTLAYTVSTLTTYTGNTPQTGDPYAVLTDGTHGNAALHTQIGAPWQVGTKYGVTLAATDVTGNLAADLQTIKTQSVTCAAGVTFLPNVGTATHALVVDTSGNVILAASQPTYAPALAGSAPSWYTAPDNTDIATILTDVGNLITTVGVAGAGLTGIPGLTDPWDVSLPGSYAQGKAGYIIGHQLGGTFTTATSSVFTTASLANVGSALTDPYLAARQYGKVDPPATDGSQIFYSPPNASDGGNVAKVKFTPTYPQGGRSVVLDP